MPSTLLIKKIYEVDLREEQMRLLIIILRAYRVQTYAQRVTYANCTIKNNIKSYLSFWAPLQMVDMHIRLSYDIDVVSYVISQSILELTYANIMYASLQIGNFSIN